MKYLVALLLLLAITFTSCDGRDRKLNKMSESKGVSEIPGPFFIQEEYFPKEYSEVLTDTIFNNNINVSIKSYTDMNNNVLNEGKVDSIHYKHFYREIISDLAIKIDGKTIFNETIDKSYFKDNEEKLFWDEALMLGLYVDYEQTTKEYLYFYVSYCMIESETCKDYSLIIDNNGKLVIKELITEEAH